MKKIMTFAMALIFAVAVMPFVSAQTANTTQQKSTKTEQKKNVHKKGSKKTTSEKKTEATK
jgi:Ni/Co efflux regulator RcnB